MEPDGSNLRQCLDDYRTAIVQEGLPWFRRFESLQSVLAALLDEEDLAEVYATRASPARKSMIGYVHSDLRIIHDLMHMDVRRPGYLRDSLRQGA